MNPKLAPGIGGDPVVDDEQADNELHQELDEIADADRLGAQADRHGRDVPVRDHADEFDEADEGEQAHADGRKSVTVRGRQVRQIVGELIEPIDAGTGLQEKSKGGHRMKDHCVGTPLYGNGLTLCMVTLLAQWPLSERCVRGFSE